MSAIARFSKGFWLLALVVGAAAPAACSQVESSDAATTQNLISGTIEHSKTTSFAGTLAIDADGHAVKFEWEVKRIDWTALRAVWSAKVVDSGGHPSVSDDTDVTMTILVARCPGCFEFTARTSGGEELVRLTVSNSKLSAVTYSGIEASRFAVTRSTQGDAGAGDAQVAAASCALICEGELLECSEGGTAATCKPDRFRALPRCPYEVKFEAKTCAQRTGGGDETGSCTLVCEGQSFGCKDDATKATCNASLFDAVPRCPHTFEFKAGGRCAQ